MITDWEGLEKYGLMVKLVASLKVLLNFDVVHFVNQVSQDFLVEKSFDIIASHDYQSFLLQVLGNHGLDTEDVLLRPVARFASDLEFARGLDDLWLHPQTIVSL